MITRRGFAAGLAVAIIGGVVEAADAGLPPSLAEDLRKVEADSGGRLGVAVLDTASGMRAGHRAGERFPMCSTFKLLAAAAVLKRVDAGQERLDRRIRFTAADIVVNSPVTKEHVADGMSLEELCAAAMTVSDNTAGNLIMASLGGRQGGPWNGPAGGPEALTDFARSLGDSVTRLDRVEPSLNEAVPGDPRDTTSPDAMLGNLQALVLGKVLTAASREHLTGWLLGNKTGATRLRAGLPPDWRVGDKTGAGDNGTTNDVGIVWPPQRAPVLVAIYLTGTSAGAEQRNATLAAVGRAVVTALTG